MSMSIIPGIQLTYPEEQTRLGFVRYSIAEANALGFMNKDLEPERWLRGIRALATKSDNLSSAVEV